MKPLFFDSQKLKTDLMTVIAKSVDGGLSIGADEVEVAVARDQGLEVSVRRGSLENLQLSNDFSLSVSLLFGKRKGSVNMLAPKFSYVEKNVFELWLKIKNKLGGQHKIPRVQNDRIFIEELLDIEIKGSGIR